MPRVVRVFLAFLCFALAGYAVLGRNFAYLGYPPLYIGEIVLALGIVAALAAGNLAAAILNGPGIMLALLMVWTALRTVPYCDEYGLDAPRDAMIVFYGFFSYISAALILQRPAIWAILIQRYKRFIPFIIFLAPIVPIVGYFSSYPVVLGQPLVGSKWGDLSCHLTAVFAFALIGFARLRPIAVLFILVVELVAFTQGREAMLAFMVGCFVASIFSPDHQVLRRAVAYIGVFAAVMAVAAVLDIQFAPRQGERTISVRQFVLNATSIFTRTDSDLVNPTKEWRLNWWSDIIGYTVKGSYFWSGRGFGPNLADTDGYQTSNLEAGEAPTRSPHNANMTVLARGGVPALVLWIATLGTWLIGILRQLVEARNLGDEWWTGAFAFLLAFWMMIVVASSFDVALEGPVMAVWFWTIHGIGVAALVLHRHRVATLHGGKLRLRVGSA